MLLEETLRNIFISLIEKLLSEDFSSGLKVGLWNFSQLLTLLNDRIKNLHKVLEGVLVEVMNFRHAIEREEDLRRHHGQRQVLLSNLLDLLHSLISLLNFL